MHFKPSQLLSDALQHMTAFNTKLMDRGTELFQSGISQLTKMSELNAYLLGKTIEGGVIPTLKSAMDIGTQVSDSFAKTLSGERHLSEHVSEMAERATSAIRYQGLIRTLGKELFGSARLQGEQRLAENEYMTLTYIPPAADRPRGPALFHSGGYLPFSDRLFRALPQANLFAPFVERGMPVYAMELKGDRERLQKLAPCTVERLVDIIDEMSDVAFAHNGEQRMVIEGYCGLAMPVLCYLAAKPERADAKFNAAMLMVAPVDGRQCSLIKEMVDSLPQQLLVGQEMLAELSDGHVAGTAIQGGLDLALGSFFHKSPFGRFHAGWNNRSLAHVKDAASLDFNQQRELAGAYWVSPENCRHFPMPMDVIKLSTNLWVDGLEDDRVLPATYRGAALDLRTIVERTKIELAGFYGAKDLVAPEATAAPLKKTLGQRYRHVVHARAGHISYVFSPEVWNKEHKKALDPNPIDLIVELYQRGESARTPCN